MKRVVVYDPDGLNPYGRELARILARDPTPVSVIVPIDTGWVPDGLRTVKVLPGNHLHIPKLVQGGLLVLSLLLVGFEVAWRRSVVVVVWTRSLTERLFFGLLGLVGVVVVVEHNPGPRGAQSSRARLGRRALLSTCAVAVAHSDALAEQVSTPRRSPVRVCPHPPYVGWCDRFLRQRTERGGEQRLRLLLLGAVRPDKGYDRVPQILRRLPPNVRSRLTLVVAGRGEVDERTPTELSTLDIELIDRSQPQFLSDEEVATVLDEADLLLAPYVGATQSSTVALALTAGVPVLAYDQGAIGELLTPEGLVPCCDDEALASRLSAFVSNPGSGGGHARDTVSDWAGATRGAWHAVLHDGDERLWRNHATPSSTRRATRLATGTPLPAIADSSNNPSTSSAPAASPASTRRQAPASTNCEAQRP